MKFRVECGSLVTVLRKRTCTVSARSEEEAAQKAEEKFITECENASRYIDVGGSVMIDSIRRVDD